jgi:hypothetical protein
MEELIMKLFKKRDNFRNKLKEARKNWEEEFQRKDVYIDQIEIRVNRKFSEELISLMEGTHRLKWCGSSTIKNPKDSEDILLLFSFKPMMSVLRDGSDINED